MLPIALRSRCSSRNAVNALVGGAAPAVQPVVAHGIALVCMLIALWGQLAVVALALDPDGGRSRAAAAATGSFARAVGAMLIVFAAAVVLALPIIGVLVRQRRRSVGS